MAKGWRSSTSRRREEDDAMNQPLRPFGGTPGRDVSKDRPPEFNLARYYYDERSRINEDAGILRSLVAAVDAEFDLKPPQWAQWYSVALGFKPDLIVELGRGKGNSTAIFCQAASRLGRTRVVSLCVSKYWSEETLPRLRPLVTPRWLGALDARTTDILDVDYETLLHGAERVLLLWDAHGFEIAETVLGRILPLLSDRPHLVLMHDISDTRYGAVPRSYEGQPLWKGSTWNQGTGTSSARVNIGWMNSLQDQVIAIADFATRNDLEIGSADHEYAQFFSAHPDAADEMKGLLGDTFFSVSAQWAFFSLSDKQPPFHFPAVQRRFRHESEVAIHDIYPPRRFGRLRALPRLIQTSPVPWAYAAVMAVRPRRDIPADAQCSLRVRVRVETAPVGLGLLSADQSVFVQFRQLLPAADQQTVWLAIDDPAAAGPLVVYTWDAPEAARVQIDELALVW
jgi:hypothetical protein